MKLSLQAKLLLMCIALILMTSIGISSTYYLLAKTDKHQESRRRIRVAFDIIFESLQERQHTYISRIREFLASNAKIPNIGNIYNDGEEILKNPRLINAYITSVSTEMKNFSRQANLATLSMYALDKRLLLSYHQGQQQDIIGMYAVSSTGQNTFLSLDDPTNLEMMKVWMGEVPIPDAPLPDELIAFYHGEIPASISSELFRDGQQLGIRIVAPVIYLDRTVGILVGEIPITQSFVERYASLSQTAINFFADRQRSVGTFADQSQIEPGVLEQLSLCETIGHDTTQMMQIASMTFGEHAYYQGACAFSNAVQGLIGAMTVNLSQDIEKQAVRKMVSAMVIVAGMTIVVAVGASILFSRKAVRFIQQLLTYINRIAEGDISDQLRGSYTGEFHEIQQKLNHMGQQLTNVIVTAKTLSDNVAMISESLNRRAEEMSQGATQQAAASEEASASMEQMAANIRQNANNAQLTERAALQSARYAKESAQVVTDTVVTMQQITQKIAIIGDIARQTRLLSLNATIESARAQEHGKAFSIVASEVRQLSDIAHKAAEEINELAGSSVEVSEKVGDMLTTLIPGIHNTTELVQEITAASNEQSTGAAQINNAIQQLDHITQQNSAISQDIATTAEELATQAQHLQHTIKFFHLE